MRWRRVLAGVALLALVLYPVLRGSLLIENAFFYPDRVVMTTPTQFGLKFADLSFVTEDGSALHGWWLPTVADDGSARAPTVLYLHGNGGNVGVHLQQVAWLPAAGFNVLMFDYRGFGHSAGKPTLNGVVADGLAALRYLRTRPDVDTGKLIVLGQSIGAATAARVLAQDQAGVKLAVLDSGFASYRGIARDAVRFNTMMSMLLPMAMPLLPSTADDPAAAIAQIEVPLLLVHGSNDLVVPFHHAEELFAAAREPKRLLRIERGQHVEGLLRPVVQSEVLDAMRAAVAQ